MLVGKALHAHLHKHANMTCELSPYSCMPNTMSQGAMANVQGRYPDLLYAPIEIKGDAEVHALSRCQMILTEAKKRAQSEFVEAMAKTGMTIEKIRQIEEKRPEVKKATYRVPHHGLCVHGGELRDASRRAQSRGARLNQRRSIHPAAESRISSRRKTILRSSTVHSRSPQWLTGIFVQIAPLMREPGVMEIKTPAEAAPSANGAKICGMDVGSTTVKYTLASASGEIISQAYERHNTKQAEKVLQFLSRLEAQHGLTPQHDRIFFTGSGAGLIAPLAGGKVIQEVVAVAASVERLHPAVRFVSEIGGEDMKTIFFNGNEKTKSKQVLMQSACSGGTGTFIEKTARKLQITSGTALRNALHGAHAP